MPRRSVTARGDAEGESAPPVGQKASAPAARRRRTAKDEDVIRPFDEFWFRRGQKIWERELRRTLRYLRVVMGESFTFHETLRGDNSARDFLAHTERYVSAQ